MRIVSLLPSATEIVCELGLGDQLVGVTHECDFPTFAGKLPKVTKTLIPHDASSAEIDTLVREQLKTRNALYTLDMPTLQQLRPDLIVTQALCDVCAVAEAEVSAAACSLPGRPQVVNLEPTCLEDVFECHRRVGQAAGVLDQAIRVVSHLRDRVDRVVQRSEEIQEHPRVVLLEWIDPPFSSGHWSPELVRLAGGTELIGSEGQHSKTITWQEIVDADPEVMVIACCGFDIRRTQQDLPILAAYSGYNELNCVRSGRVYVVDGNAYFNRPGPRLVDSLEILAHLLDPETHPPPDGSLTYIPVHRSNAP
ncbi:cobalamin-binding protein [Roseiconus lacunae]|uniref:cobalamin-binding protein n=1 Tax=Roseiconus lacunae TaxID=2605694 RepID=UPI001E430200|nr:cobalamin-binding protein [Roseiconus lacunae]MCD0458187.1 cobalamin-binding protein [Roseiconus lacunae]